MGSYNLNGFDAVETASHQTIKQIPAGFTSVRYRTISLSTNYGDQYIDPPYTGEVIFFISQPFDLHPNPEPYHIPVLGIMVAYGKPLDPDGVLTDLNVYRLNWEDAKWQISQLKEMINTIANANQKITDVIKNIE